MRGFIEDILRFAGLLVIFIVVWAVILLSAKASAGQIDDLLAAAEYELLEPPPVTDNLLAYQSGTGIIEDEDGRPWKSLIALIVVSLLFCGGMIGYILIGPEGLNGLFRQLRLARRKSPAHETPPQLSKITSVTPPPPAPQQPERHVLPGENKWLLPPGE